MNYSVQGVRAYFKSKKQEVKQGTIEAFRSKLQEAGIIGNNQPMTEEHLAVFEKVVNEKDDNNTWESLMNKFIFTDLRDSIRNEFKWMPSTIVAHLTNAIKDGYYFVEHLDPNKKEDWMILCNCIDNFTELGKVGYFYKGSKGTDANGVILFKIQTLNDSYYYVIGKLNPHTGEEDIHVFYNPLPHFEIMQCQHVAEGEVRNALFKELWATCIDEEKAKEPLSRQEIVDKTVSFAYQNNIKSKVILSSFINRLIIGHGYCPDEISDIMEEVLIVLYEIEQKEREVLNKPKKK